jgi:malonate transporter and related proteins
VFSALGAVLPIFALIVAGTVCRRAGIFGPTATSELNRFVVWLGLPSLMFHITASAGWEGLYLPGFTAAFGISCFAMFALALVVARRRGVAEGAVNGLIAGYPNTGYLGFPLALAVFGPASSTGVTIASIMTICVMFGVAIMLLEIGLQEERRLGPLIGKVSLSLVKNPLVVSPALGMLWAATGIPLPRSVDAGLLLLGAAASPCALVALGTFLAEKRPWVAGQRSTEIFLATTKLLVQPALAFVLAHYVFDLTKFEADLAVLMAALPTGTGPFMLAEYYKRDAAVTAKVILATTLCSLVTITLFLTLSGYGDLPG